MAMADNIVMSEMTWTEVDEAMKERPVALIPVGATEAHGPHLPVSTDTVIATEMARRGAVKLKEHGVPSLILPPVNFTVTDFGADFSGTITIPPETAVALMRDLAASVARKFRAVAFINIHLEPRHMECLKQAVDEAKKAGVSVCYVDITKKRWADQMDEAFRQGDHAGAWETSLMMAAAPDMVRERERISLPPVDGLMPAIKKGDLAQLTRIPGVGRKTAERMVVELRDKMAALESTTAAARPVAAGRDGIEGDVISALINLGYERRGVERAVEEAARSREAAAHFEALLKASLQRLSKV